MLDGRSKYTVRETAGRSCEIVLTIRKLRVGFTVLERILIFEELSDAVESAKLYAHLWSGRQTFSKFRVGHG